MISPLAASLWLEGARLEIQGAWFALFFVALCLSIAALHQEENEVLFRVARGLWLAAMLALVVGWLAGALLEMMGRAAGVSGRDLLAALGAFSVLIAGVLSLVREWFGARWSDALRGDRLALSLVILTLAGWWFGGFCLENNPLWRFSDEAQNRAPDAWALLLGGATLLGFSRVARSRDEATLRARNPRVVMLWMAAIAGLLAAPAMGDNPRAASVFLVGAGAFLVKIWRARRDKPLLLRVNFGTRAVLVLAVAMAPLLWKPKWEFWASDALRNWQAPTYDVAFVIFVATLFFLGVGAREPLRLAVFEFFCRRALLAGALAGVWAATLIFGPAGAIFWGFWPLAGLFFDLLSPDEPQFTAANSGAPSVANPVSAGSGSA